MYLLVINSYFTLKYLKKKLLFLLCLYEPLWSMRFNLINIMSTEPMAIIKRRYLVVRMV